MKLKIEKKLRELWKAVRSSDAPYPHMAEDIEEFLDAGEWQLAFEHIVDWAEADKKLSLLKPQIKDIKQEMKQLPSKKAD